jgi:hypothetical protein
VGRGTSGSGVRVLIFFATNGFFTRLLNESLKTLNMKRYAVIIASLLLCQVGYSRRQRYTVDELCRAFSASTKKHIGKWVAKYEAE